MRAVPEWIGKTDDSPVPPRVRLRVFEAHGRNCGVCIMPIWHKRWQCDHIVALCIGGENRESNLQPVHEACHVVKTAEDLLEKQISIRVKMKDLGFKKRKGRPMPGSRDSGIKMKIGGGWERR
jgi:5-methylcytosine-specific restriction protein A